MKNQKLKKYKELLAKREILIKETEKLEHTAFNILNKALNNPEKDNNDLE